VKAHRSNTVIYRRYLTEFLRVLTVVLKKLAVAEMTFQGHSRSSRTDHIGLPISHPFVIYQWYFAKFHRFTDH